jgi:hypothetical protein
MSDLRYLCLFGHSVVLHILCCAFLRLYFQFIFIIHFSFFFNLDFLQRIILARTENIELDCCQTNGRMDGWMDELDE